MKQVKRKYKIVRSGGEVIRKQTEVVVVVNNQTMEAVHRGSKLDPMVSLAGPRSQGVVDGRKNLSVRKQQGGQQEVRRRVNFQEEVEQQEVRSEEGGQQEVRSEEGGQQEVKSILKVRNQEVGARSSRGKGGPKKWIEDLAADYLENLDWQGKHINKYCKFT